MKLRLDEVWISTDNVLINDIEIGVLLPFGNAESSYISLKEAELIIEFLTNVIKGEENEAED